MVSGGATPRCIQKGVLRITADVGSHYEAFRHPLLDIHFAHVIVKLGRQIDDRYEMLYVSQEKVAARSLCEPSDELYDCHGQGRSGDNYILNVESNIIFHYLVLSRMKNIK